MTTGGNQILVNMPLLLSRSALIKLDDGSYVTDTAWYERTRKLYQSLFSFLSSKNLISSGKKFEPIDDAVLSTKDLTSEGRLLWETGSIYRWIGSFDRNPTKNFGDYKILEKALQQKPKKEQPGRR